MKSAFAQDWTHPTSVAPLVIDDNDDNIPLAIERLSLLEEMRVMSLQISYLHAKLAQRTLENMRLSHIIHNKKSARRVEHEHYDTCSFAKAERKQRYLEFLQRKSLIKEFVHKPGTK